jgi:dihydroceramidase
VSGYWEGAPADVNWCEPDFVYTPYVAEAWNTASSLPMVVWGLVGLRRAIRSGLVPERRFWINFAGLAFVGLGSAAFHGTLLRWAQALDELPMIWLGLVGVWTVWHRAAPREAGKGMAALFFVFSALFGWAYLNAPAFFTVFVFTYAGLVTYMVIAAIRSTWGDDGPPALRRMFIASAATYLGTLALCWIPEHVLLPCDHPIQALPLHAMWHLGAGFGTYAWVVWSILDRRRLQGLVLDVEPGIAPFVRSPA